MLDPLALHARLGGALHRLAAESWALHVAAWRPSTPERFEREWTAHPADRREVVVFNRRCFENRYSQQFGDTAYAYAGQTAAATPVPDASACAAFLPECDAALGGAGLNTCLQNWYEPEHWLGDHRDAERQLVPGAPIASLSWGAARRFALKPKPVKSAAAAAADSVALELYLRDGDLLLMGGATQLTHVHGVPKRRKKDEGAPGRRISWTFRAFRPEGEPKAARKRKRVEPLESSLES
mmetsp:Transcript_10716/g.33041  ORF Transcript_10716/g.33041 Transcript_10716/m.33041 type:complete len:239 (+) Transcript_10716:689-1405(+)